MINKESRLTISVGVNKLLLMGCLLLANMLLIKAAFYTDKSAQITAIHHYKMVSVQKALLESVISGYEKEHLIGMLKKEAAKPQNENIELKINDNAITFGKIKFILENGKVTHVE